MVSDKIINTGMKRNTGYQNNSNARYELTFVGDTL